MELVFDISQDELPIFLAETDDHLQVLDDGLLQLERNDDDPETMHALFRAAHTFKGMAGMIGHKRLVDLTHTLETVFDGIRKNQLTISTLLIDTCLEAVDALRLLRMEVVENRASAIDIHPILENLRAIITSTDHLNIQSSSTVKRKEESSQASNNQISTSGEIIDIEVSISDQSIASAARAFQVIMALQEMGEISKLDPSMEHIESARPVKILRASIKTNNSVDELSSSLNTISELEKISINGQEINLSMAGNLADNGSEKKDQAPPPSIKPAAPASSPEKKPESGSIDKTIRTSVERLDNLMNLVGELITDRNRLNQIRTTLELTYKNNEKISNLSETITHIARITDQLQEEVMRIRMVPVANVFNKFPRLVRDLSQKTGKEIQLDIFGQDTEMDRSVIEHINDPLIHLIRNAIDHGIETPETRIKSGKNPRGTITLTARHEQGRIILTVEDDGKGINTQKLRQTAIQRGIVSEQEAAAMSEEKSIDLIFMSGLTTAEKVTDISGRGVGMDIVRNNIERINGTIIVESIRGKGSKFQIVLPLTLAIVPTLLVKVENMSLAIPMVMVLETQRVSQSDVQTINGKPVTILRNHVLPLVKLSEIFNIRRSNQNQKNGYMVVVGNSKTQVGLLVDTLIGEEEVVVKSLGVLIGEIPGISSAAILGDGQVALILDVQGIFKLTGAY